MEDWNDNETAAEGAPHQTRQKAKMNQSENRNGAGASGAIQTNGTDQTNEPNKPSAAGTPAQAQAPTGRELFRRYPGLDLLPIPAGLKYPRGLRYDGITFTEADFSATAPQNVGLRFSGPHVDADLDCLEAVAMAHIFLPPTQTWGRAGKPRSHWLYVHAEAAARGVRLYHDVKRPDGTAPMLVEQRCGDANKLSVLPGSTWVSSSTGAVEAIVFNDEVAPAAFDPTENIRALACATILVRNWADDRGGARAALCAHYDDLKTQYILKAIDGFCATRPKHPLAPAADQAAAHARIGEWFGVRTARVSTDVEDWPEPDVLTLDDVTYGAVVNAVTAAYPPKQRDIFRLDVAGMLHEKRFADGLIEDVLVEARKRVLGPIDEHAIEHSAGAARRDWNGRAGRVIKKYPGLGQALVDIVERVHPDEAGLGSWRPTRRVENVDGQVCPDVPAPPANDVGPLASAPALVLAEPSATQLVTAWDPQTGSLFSAPRDVSRAIRGARKAPAPGEKRDLGANSKQALTWMFEQHASPDAVCAWLELPPSEMPALRKMSTEAIAGAGERDAAVSVGRLTRIDQQLVLHDMRWNEMKLRIECDREPWTDNHTAGLRLLLEQTGASDPEKPIPNGDIEQRARAVAVPYHPVVEYLNALPAWDGVPRVDALWPRYFGAVDSELNRALGSCFTIGAVRRVLHPGTKVDMMPILFGDQGERKSTALSVLAGGRPAFTDAKWNGKHRAENAMTLTGCWIWEIPELQGFDRDDQNDIKAFVTRESDDVLLPYARNKDDLPRRSVMIGTTNDEKCLKDPTGSRRHPVITIGALDVDALKADRDQLWAEALHRMKAGEQHWLTDELEQARAEVNEAHQQREETLIEALQKWFRFPRTSIHFTMTDALAGLGYADRAHDRPLETRIGLALKQMGVKSEQVGKLKIRTYTFPGCEQPTGETSAYLAFKY